MLFTLLIITRSSLGEVFIYRAPLCSVDRVHSVPSSTKLLLPVATEFTRHPHYRAPPCSGYQAHSVSFGYRVVHPSLTELTQQNLLSFASFGYRAFGSFDDRVLLVTKQAGLSLDNSCCRAIFWMVKLILRLCKPVLEFVIIL